MVRLHEWSAPSCNPTTRTLGRDDDRPHDAEDDLRRGMIVRRTSTRAGAARGTNSRVTVPMSLSSSPLRGRYRVAGPRTSRREQLKVPLDNMHATG